MPATRSAQDHVAAALVRWDLIPDGDPIATQSSRLLPVRRAGVPARLKVALAPEERHGAAVMAWWNGDGAARVLARAGDAVPLERERLLRWVFALAGLSACWILEDGGEPVNDLAIASLAAAELRA